MKVDGLTDVEKWHYGIKGPIMGGERYSDKIVAYPFRDLNDLRGIVIEEDRGELYDMKNHHGRRVPVADSQPDIDNPRHGNRIVSPSNFHTNPQ